MCFHGEHVSAARRRRERLRQFLRHEHLNIAMALAESTTTQPQGNRIWPGPERGGGSEQNNRAETPPLQPELFEMFDEEPSLAGVRTQERVQRHTVEQIVDATPGLPMLDAPVPLMVEQLVDVLRFFDALSACCRAGYRRVQDPCRGHSDANLSRTAAGGMVGGGCQQSHSSFWWWWATRRSSRFSPITRFSCIILIISLSRCCA